MMNKYFKKADELAIILDSMKDVDPKIAEEWITYLGKGCYRNGMVKGAIYATIGTVVGGALVAAFPAQFSKIRKKFSQNAERQEKLKNEKVDSSAAVNKKTCESVIG